jgi:superfamily II DNA or RNA helicase
MCPNGLVYNLEVETNHNYFVNDTLVHNCHHSSAPIFCRSVNLFYGFRLGLTATPDRTDGTQIVYNSHIGKVLYKNLRQELTPQFQFVWTGIGIDLQDPLVRQAVVDKNNEVHLSKLATHLGKCRARLEKIISMVRQHEEAGRKTMVLSNTVGELVNLLALYNGRKDAYTDIPMPTPADFDSNLVPQEAHKLAHARMEAELKRAKLALFDTNLNATRKEHIKKKLIPHIETRLAQHELAKGIRRELEHRQRKYVKELIQEPSNAGLMIARVPTEMRMSMLRSKNTIFTIYRYGLEGLDDAELDTIIAAEPMTAKNAIQQFVGRILRKRKREKFPLVQFLEDDVGPYIGMCKVVRRILREWPVDEGGPYKYELIDHPYLKEKRTWKVQPHMVTGLSSFQAAGST